MDLALPASHALYRSKGAPLTWSSAKRLAFSIWFMSLSFVWQVYDHGKRPVEEVANGGRGLCAVRLQREMAGVEETDLGAWDIARERFGSGGQEERVVLAPHRE